MAKKNKSSASFQKAPSGDMIKDHIARWFGVLGFLTAVSFCVQAKDSAQIKTTLFYAGAFGLFALWLCGLWVKRINIFTKNNLKSFLPFVVLFLYVLLSYLAAPNFLGRSNNFIYFLSCAMVFTAAAFEADENAVQKIISALIVTCWVVFTYGLLQIFNRFLPGADIFFWSDFFGSRVFSTFANPNFFADFCLIAVMVLAAVFLKTRAKKVLLLILLGLINIFFTESKGAWLALAAGAPVFGILYFSFFTSLSKKNKMRAAAIALAAVLLAGAVTAFYGYKRMRSVNFRLYTWASAVEMIKNKPLAGYGAGSFFIEYPAFKKPQIFYIEAEHKSQTTHAENHYLEILATQGIAGFALFIWAAFYLAYRVYLTLRQRKNDYALLGFSAALFAVYVHNFVDISLYLPSTGYFAALLAGSVFGMTHGLDYAPSAPSAAPRKAGAWLYICGFAAVLLMAAISLFVLKDFAFMTEGMLQNRPLLFFISWAFLLFTVGCVCYVFISVIFKYKSAACAVIFAAASVIMFCFWGLVKADYYTAVAGALAERGDINNALLYYTKAVKRDRFNSSLYNFRGIVLSARMDGALTFRPQEGDTEPLNDYTRATQNFEAALKLNPREPLLFYNWGTMQLAAAAKADIAERFKLYEAARHNFLRALELDPVFENTYFQLFNIEISKNNPRAAYEWLLKYTRGPQGVTEPEYLKIHRENKTANAHLAALRAAQGN